jgi:hypothetical protein
VTLLEFLARVPSQQRLIITIAIIIVIAIARIFDDNKDDDINDEEGEEDEDNEYIVLMASTGTRTNTNTTRGSDFAGILSNLCAMGDAEETRLSTTSMSMLRPIQLSVHPDTSSNGQNTSHTNPNKNDYRINSLSRHNTPARHHVNDGTGRLTPPRRLTSTRQQTTE